MRSAGGGVRVGEKLIGEQGYVDAGVPNGDQDRRELLVFRERDFARGPDVGFDDIVERDVRLQDLGPCGPQRDSRANEIAGGDQIPGLGIIERSGFLNSGIKIGFYLADGHCFRENARAGIGSLDRVLHDVPRQRVDRFLVMLTEGLFVSCAAGALGVDSRLDARAGE